jgi:short subunit dehydrogenase-like uncharacterized protein
MPAEATANGREYEIIVWGASGFTGRLVVEYLATNYPPGESLNWAVGGRSREKLEQVLESISWPVNRPDILIADSHDVPSMQDLVTKSAVVLSTVGPYAKYGSELVAACVAAGTHYCDLCGETQWIRKMIDEHQEAAEKSGARILMSCAFDSVPSDIGVYFLNKHAAKVHCVPCTSITMLVRAMKGGPSGGTIASMLNVIEEARSDPAIARILRHPYALNPTGQQEGPDGPDQRSPVFNEDEGVWTAPFVMAGINTRTVRRTNALLDFRYGRDFRYHEATIAGRGFRGRLKARMSSVGLKLFVIAAVTPFLRRFVLKPILPDPGEGPTREQRENGYFNLLMLGKLPGGETLRLRIKGDRDPGYGSTSKMLAECAVCLAKDDPEVGGGLWTPAAALGDKYLRRLTDHAGLSFELE